MFYKSNKLKDIQKYFVIKLKPKYEEDEAKMLVSLLIEHILKINRAEISLNYDVAVNESDIVKLEKYTNRLLNNEPLQYIIGESEFYNIKIKVKNGVLIPRPETEELIDIVLNKFKNTKIDKAIDIGSGSACITISLAKNLNAKVTAIDISDDAIKTGKENAEINNVNIYFKKLDILDKSNWKKLESDFDLIISNPPYVKNSEKKLMQKNVLDFEPHQALFVDDNNPLIFYKEISDFAAQKLNSNGIMAFEINESLGKDTLNIIDDKLFKSKELLKDFNGKDRFIICIKN